MIFTDEERARAAEIRAWAERPENVRALDTRCDSEHHGGTFDGIRTCYSLRRINDRTYRIVTYSRADCDELPDPALCWIIAVELFGFRPSVRPGLVTDPVVPWVAGFSQPFEAS